MDVMIMEPVFVHPIVYHVIQMMEFVQIVKVVSIKTMLSMDLAVIEVDFQGTVWFGFMINMIIPQKIQK